MSLSNQVPQSEIKAPSSNQTSFGAPKSMIRRLENCVMCPTLRNYELIRNSIRLLQCAKFLCYHASHDLMILQLRKP